MTDETESLDFVSNPKVVKNYMFLENLGVFKYINSLNKEIKSYKNLLAGAVEIFNKLTIDEILDAAVWKISDQFLPSFITFIWKPHQNRKDVTFKSYKNYKQVDFNIPIQTITLFEPFFRKFPRPVAFDIFAIQEGCRHKEIIEMSEQLAPELLVPILGPHGLYGVVLAGKKNQAKGYTADELYFLEQLISFVSQAVQNNLHYEHSVRDVKTGLYNHGYFMTRLTEEIARTKRETAVSSLLVMDVDKFKNFNDSYGHLAGDRVLETLAFTIKQAVRQGDIPCRFGGEEFTLLLPNTSRQTAWLVAERLRTMIAAMKVPWEPPLPQVTISLGAVSFDKQTNTPPEEVIARADEALYQSKRNGRNKTTVWGAGLLFRIQNSRQNSGSASA